MRHVQLYPHSLFLPEPLNRNMEHFRYKPNADSARS